MASAKPIVSNASTVAARVWTDAPTAMRMQDALAEALGASAAVSIAEGPDGRWSFVLHFGVAPDEEDVRALVASVAGEPLGAALAFENLAPTDWVRRSLEGLSPVEAGRFTVHGRHDRERIGPNRIAVEIEATLAFGTGHHASTRGCLLALDRLVRQGRTRRRKRMSASLRRAAAVLDIGTGTGVLAIAAAKALQAGVLASDIDARAVAIAREHACANGAAAHVEVVHAAGIRARRFRERSPVALVLANILLDPLRDLATPMRALVAPGGAVVLAGLLNAQARSAIASYRARGFIFAARIVLGGWTTLIMRRPCRGRTTS